MAANAMPRLIKYDATGRPHPVSDVSCWLQLFAIGSSGCAVAGGGGAVTVAGDAVTVAGGVGRAGGCQLSRGSYLPNSF